MALLALVMVICAHSASSQPDQNRELRHRRLFQKARAAAALATQVSDTYTHSHQLRCMSSGKPFFVLLDRMSD